MRVWLEMSTWAATRSSVGSLYIVHHGPRSMASRGWAGWKFAAAPITGPVVSLNSGTGGSAGGGRLLFAPPTAAANDRGRGRAPARPDAVAPPPPHSPVSRLPRRG